MTIGSPGFQSQNHLSTHSIAGTFGSSAAAASSAGLSAQQMRWVLDYASQQASGIKAWQRDTDHIEKAFVFAGMPARNGVTAAEIVQSGGTGVDDVLSGQDNFLLAYAPQADAGKLAEKLGERYEIARTNIKKWSVGSPIQAPLDALENLQKKHPFTADQVQALVVRLPTGEAALVNNREMPDICLQYMVAVTLIDKTASFRSSHDKARMSEASVVRQRAKVQLVGDEALERRLPRREAIVEVTLADGTHLSEHVDAVRGTAENPMPREEVVAKCRDLMSPVLGAQKCEQIIARILDLENVKNVRELRPLLQRT
jgi:2-methylcitrate dehydratase PrpD